MILRVLSECSRSKIADSIKCEKVECIAVHCWYEVADAMQCPSAAAFGGENAKNLAALTTQEEIQFARPTTANFIFRKLFQ